MAETTTTPAAGPPPLPRPETREEEADRALRHTAFAPGVAPALCALFLLTIAAIPVLQHVVEIRRNVAARREARAQDLPTPPLLPQAWDVLRLLPTWAEIRAVHHPADALALLPPEPEIRAFETALEEQSVLSEWALPPVQQSLTGLLGAGNEQAYVGREGWLHYRPDVEYLTGPGFLDPARLRLRESATVEGGQTGAAVQPDPVKALVRFHEQLSARGIRLIVVPVPVKPMLHPEKLSARYGPSSTAAALQNASYARFLGEMARAGVTVFGAPAAVAEAPGPQFLAADTHWTPAAMERTASALARFVTARGGLPPDASGKTYTRREAEVASGGDIVDMLKLPRGQRLFVPQRVRVHPVDEAETGEPWYPHRNADVLLLGDSFSNIYSLGGMGWGEGAGFAPQLSYYLQRPVDAIVVNAGGAYAARQRLRQEMLRGRDRLRGKRVVLYEFAIRDLASGDWKLLDLPPRKRTAGDGIE